MSNGKEQQQGNWTLLQGAVLNIL